jgi:cytidine deaminase
MRLDQQLVDAAIDLMNRRFLPDAWAGAAAMATREGVVLTSLYMDRGYGSAGLCYETGAICEAHKLGHTVTASACVARAPRSDRVLILTPCGICQERLFYWGAEVEVAVPDSADPTRWQAKRLRDVQPHFWAKVLDAHLGF